MFSKKIPGNSNNIDIIELNNFLTSKNIIISITNQPFKRSPYVYPTRLAEILDCHQGSPSLTMPRLYLTTRLTHTDLLLATAFELVNHYND